MSALTESRKFRWGLVAAVVFMAVLLALQERALAGYLQSWGGTAFKGMSGALIGWLVSRYVVGLDLSIINPEQRPLAGLSQAIVIAAFVIALATGA